MCDQAVGFLGPIVGIVTGTVIGVIAEPIRRWLFRPTLRVVFDPNTCKLHTPTMGKMLSEGYYVRVQVINESNRIAKACRVYLVNIEEKNTAGEFVRTVYVDSLRCNWSSQLPEDALLPLDLAQGVSQFADVIATDKFSPHTYSPQVHVVPNIYASLFDAKPKTLRLTVLVTGDEVKPATAKVVFVWKGDWDTFTADAG